MKNSQNYPFFIVFLSFMPKTLFLFSTTFIKLQTTSMLLKIIGLVYQVIDFIYRTLVRNKIKSMTSFNKMNQNDEKPCLNLA